MRGRLIIDPKKIEEVFSICSLRKKGEGVDKLATSLKEFINERISTEDPELFKLIVPRHYPSESSLKRLLKPGEKGYLMKANHPYLDKILDMYVESYKGLLGRVEPELNDTGNRTFGNTDTEKGRNCFSSDVIITLSKRAGGVCSNPYCRRITSGPVLADPGKVYDLGVACHIYGAQQGDPRYDPLTRHKHDDIENGIWLCSFDAQMINENKGADYPATLLKEWKSTHEELMHACLEGKKKIFFSLNQNDKQSELAVSIISFFNSQHILFAALETVTTESIIFTVKSIGTFLLEQSADIIYGTKLQEQVYAIDYTCDAFLDFVNNTGNTTLIRYSFAAFKKIIGMMLMEMAAYYKVEFPDCIREIAPEI